MGTGNNATTGSPLAKDQPYTGGLAVDVSAADASLATNCRGILVGVAGTMKLDFIDGSTVTTGTLLAGTVYRFAAKKIYQAGTTATGIVVLL